MLGRTGEIEVGMPGGCNLGARPIDQHIKGFELLGANVEIGKGTISAKANCLKGAHIYMDVVSVGATINVMLASVLAKGTTTIDNAAKEPHIVDVANFLNTMGADIRGAGTDVIKINGVEKLHGNATYSVVPDQIEAGTFMLAAMASKGDLLIKNCITKHLEPLTAKILEIGGNVEDNGDSIRVWYSKRPNKATIKTLPYPGFPTDLQPQMGVVLSTANGTSIINESIWESRFQYTAELNKMGAKIEGAGTSVITIEGVKKLNGANIDVIPDRIEAGTYLMIGAMIGNNLTVSGVIPSQIEALFDKFDDMGIKYLIEGNKVTISKCDNIKPINIKTLVYPGFPTDLGQPISVLLTQANGTSYFEETIWENRMQHVKYLNKMGANITLQDNAHSIIIGPSKLKGCEINATDLRGGAALVMAGLIASGTTKITNIEYILRGYENLAKKLKQVGADIEIIDED